jgi:hypothetical protein
MWGFTSWNLCGLHKLARHPGVLEWLRSQKVIFIQESLQLSRTFRFPGFARFDVAAIETRRRASGGLIILLAKDWLGNGEVETIHESASLLLVRVKWGSVGLMLGNIYAPIHGDSCPTDIYDSIVGHIEAVSSLYPNDSLLIGTCVPESIPLSHVQVLRTIHLSFNNFLLVFGFLDTFTCSHHV